MASVPCVRLVLNAMILAHPALSIQLTAKHSESVRPTLHVVVPCWSGDIFSWTRLLATVRSVNETLEGRECGYERTVLTTVVSDENERREFEERLALIRSGCDEGSSRISEYKIRTLEEVLRSTEAVNDRDLPVVMSMMRNPANKHYIQASKKFYGCLDAAGVQVNGSSPGQADVCHLVDSDSVMLKNSFCHIATEYSKKKTVFYSGNVGEDESSKFYAMESYHWLFEVEVLQQFVQNLTLPSRMLEIAAQGLDHMPGDRTAYFEERLYHWLYPLRSTFGYTYVDVYDMLEGILGARTFGKLNAMGNGYLFEGIPVYMPLVSHEEAVAVGRALASHGVLQVKCLSVGEENVQAMLEPIDFCGSQYDEAKNGINLTHLAPSCDLTGVPGPEGVLHR